MELIVKIGADQQKLQDTIQRMKQSFRNMDVSMPAGWVGRSPMQLTAGQRAAMAATGAEEGLLTGVASKAGLKRLFDISLRGGAIVAATSYFSEFWNWLTEKFSKAFWENVYGVSDEMNARISRTHVALKKSASEVLDLRAKEAAAREQDIRGLHPESKRDLMESRLASAEKTVTEARGKFDYAKRAEREATGYGSKPLTTDQAQRLAAETAAAEAQLIRARMARDEAKREFRTALDDAVAFQLEQKRAEARARSEAAAKDASPALRFQADNLAAAGLFAGSSLLFNPAMNIEQQQLEVLRAIAENTGRHSTAFAP